MKSLLIGVLIVVASGCVTIPEPVQFKGGATSDHKQLGGMTWVQGAVKTPCRVTSVRREGQVISLEC